jgi:ubiquinol-cytochrome c reductase cytochrome c subunit
MKRLFRPITLIPLAIGCLALGLGLLHGGEANALSAPGVSGASNYGAGSPAATQGAAVGSGENNLYSRVGNGVPQDPNPGQYLYIQGCSTCHGLNGQGSKLTDKVSAPPLIGVGAAAVDFYVSTGRMPLNQPVVQAPRKKPAYNRAQINELVKYVTSLSPPDDKGPAIPAVDTSKASDVQGYQIFANNCAACHNSQGSGGALGRDYYAPRLYSATPTQVAEAVRIGPGSMPVFDQNTLSNQQVNSLVKYVVGLKDQNNRGGLSIGGIGPVSEGFVGWVVGLGLLLALTRWIGTRV